ncbi:hypothetical protein [Nocardia suismassiliense]|uniref:hypothetical protein n=1 Tax=Nocardia suismassiliense TaxID=2077092 RepID=UPI00131F0216|nr:hypothetical protein [Nocardia suismassiliense]
MDPHGKSLPRVAEFVAELNRDYGTEYTRALTLAIEYAAADDQARYKLQLRAASAVLSSGDRSHHEAKALAVGHVGSILGALRADVQQGSSRGRPD